MKDTKLDPRDQERVEFASQLYRQVPDLHRVFIWNIIVSINVDVTAAFHSKVGGDLVRILAEHPSDSWDVWVKSFPDGLSKHYKDLILMDPALRGMKLFFDLCEQFPEHLEKETE